MTTLAMSHSARAPDSDEGLADQAIHNSAAFSELYQRHLQRVYRYHLARTGNVMDAQDLTTQTFLAALEGLPRYRRSGTFRAWLMSIAHHKMALHYRSSKIEAPLESSEIHSTPASSPEEVLIKRLDYHEISLAMSQLPVERAEAVMLVVLAELNSAEAAEIMAKSPAAVRMLVMRGLRELRKICVPISQEAI